ncbi:outer membrane protein assembly factor BamA [Falsirhodobacter halotolerans]|uniref:outer membrane protein assembly factor BamA n=1 Tax=Falsirhodobacter halotolerans TaxID=1146892 RepID=UPI001FD2BAD9|nr:outer membrane protein assembly factor BamA [Falsirhodobacter halotolerans]MCJ8139645.1 outer membrane protein assembly factor BamA [Falsirhodobacter halotolerans]
MGRSNRRVGKAGLRPAVVSVFLGMTAAGAAVIPAIAQSYSFSNVVVKGNDRVDVPTVLSFAGIQAGQSLSAGELNSAYQRLVNSNLFQTVEMVPQGGTLVIRVSEYPIISRIAYEGNSVISDERLAEVVKSQTRRAYSPAQAEADAAAITLAYSQSGRNAATVEPQIIRRTQNRVDLVFTVTEGRVAEVERIAFAGNRTYSDRRLRQVLETRQAGILRRLISADTFIPERVQLDRQLLRDFYLSRGFADVQIPEPSAELTRERNAFFITFNIQEGQRYRMGNVALASEVAGIDLAPFQRQLWIKPGSYYSPASIDNVTTRMENVGVQEGLNFVRVEPRISRNEAAGTLDVTFTLVRGPRVFVERIDIEGNTTTQDRVIRRQFRTVEGDPFNPREIRQAAERIRALGFFADAQVESQQGSAPDQVLVNVDVEEQPTGSLSFGVAYGAVSGVGFNIGFSESNFLGRGQFLGIDIGTGSDSVNSTFTFAEPGFLGRDLRFAFQANYTETNNENADYNTKSIGFGPSLAFPVGENSRLELRYRLSQDEISGVDRASFDEAGNQIGNGSSAILQREEALGERITSAVGYTYSYDTRTNGINPLGGILLRFGQDFAGVGGDVQSVKTSFTAVAERRVWNEDLTLRAVFEGGALTMLDDDVSTVPNRYFGNSIRGFDPNGLGPRDLQATNRDALGGNYFAVARLESEFPIGLPAEYGITGGLFADAGSVWGLDDNIGTNGVPVDDSAHLRSSVGFSIFWTTPIGPLRLNFTRALVKEDYDEVRNFDLTVSTRF